MKNKNYFNKILLFFMFLIGSKTIFAQTNRQNPTDGEAWYSAKIKFDLPKKWALSTEYQARLYDDFTTHYGSYITVAAEKKISKPIEILANYRLAFVEKGIYNRISLGAEAQIEWHDFEFGLRILTQKNWKNFAQADKATREENFWRTRLTAAYNISKKTNIYLSIEPIMEIRAEKMVDNLRNSIGLKYRIEKNTKLDLFYIYNPDYSKSYNRVYHILGLGLNYTINSRK